MIIGVDFDNTIVCYDGIFHRVALERGLIPPDLPQDKTAVRDHLRKTGREAEWTQMQGVVYGPRLIDAQPYPGVRDFFRAAVEQGIMVCVISHKTKHPFLGEPHDLHAAAWNWLEANGFFDPESIGIQREQVYLELTKEAKHQRIGAAGCTCFIDDLPEFLLDAGFPQGVERIHFDPCGSAQPGAALRSIQNWPQISSELLLLPRVSAFARETLATDTLELTPVQGGANNRLFHAASEGAAKEVIIKAYHHSSADLRNRFAAEQVFYQLDLPQTAGPLAWDTKNRLGAFGVIHGRKLVAEEITAEDVTQCIAWICGLQACREAPAAQKIALAADACLTIADHIALVERRVQRLLNAGCRDAEFRNFVVHDLAPQVAQITAPIRQWGETGGAVRKRVLSPSDFGFHNALKDATGRLWFFDFEYAGWDDPAKLVCDFFCQPQVPVPVKYADAFISALQHVIGDDGLPERCKMLMPLHVANWSCIMLNEFLSDGAKRRVFATDAFINEEGRNRQLEKARLKLQTALC